MLFELPPPLGLLLLLDSKILVFSASEVVGHLSKECPTFPQPQHVTWRLFLPKKVEEVVFGATVQTVLNLT